MPLASPGGPGWIRRQYVAGERRRYGFGPIRAFVVALVRGFGSAHGRPGPSVSDVPAPRERDPHERTV